MLNVYTQAIAEKDRIVADAILHAYAFAAMQGLKEDDISEREAFSLYGKAWVLDRTRRGMIHFERSGASETSAKVYSRFEILCLKRAEKNVEDAVREAERRIDKAEERSKKVSNKAISDKYPPKPTHIGKIKLV